MSVKIIKKINSFSKFNLPAVLILLFVGICAASFAPGILTLAESGGNAETESKENFAKNDSPKPKNKGESTTAEKETDGSQTLGGAGGKLLYGLALNEPVANKKTSIFAKDPTIVSTPSPLTGVNDINPSWSANGGKIVYVSRRDGDAPNGYPQSDREIYTMNSDGTSQRRLTANFTSEADPSFSPDGTKIVYIGGTGAGNFGIYTMNADGTNPTLLIDDNNPCLTPTLGEKRKSRRSNQNQKLASYTYPGYLDFETPNFHPNAAPGNEKIVFGYVGYVFTMNPDGTGCSLFYTSNNYAAEPRYSPDGTKIVIAENTGNV